MTQKPEEKFSARLMFGGFKMPGRPNFGPVFAPDDGGGSGGSDGGQQGGEGQQNGGDQGGQSGGQSAGQQQGGHSGGDGQQGGQATASWRDAIKDPDLKKQAERFNSVEDIIRGNLEQRQKLSAAIIKPGKDAKAEEIAAYRKAMDIPENPEGYELAKPEHIDDETFNSDGMKATLGAFTKLAHEANFTKAQTQALWSWYNATEAASIKAQIEADKAFANKANEALKAEWGADYDKNREFAKRGFEKLAIDAGLDIHQLKTIELKDGRFLLDRPEFSRLFAKLGREMGEGQIGSVLSDGDRDSIQQQIDKLQDEKMAALSKGDRARANKLDQEQNALYAKLDANKAA